MCLLLFSAYIYLSSGGNDGDVRLVDGTVLNEGRVEVYYNSTWHTICDDSFGINDAHVVCRQLGYQEAVDSDVDFGAGSGEILLDDLACTGREASLLSCDHSGVGIHNCGHVEDVGIRCMCLR